MMIIVSFYAYMEIIQNIIKKILHIWVYDYSYYESVIARELKYVNTI